MRDRVKETFIDLGEKTLKNIARSIRVFAIKTEANAAVPPHPAPASEESGPSRLSIVVLPFANMGGDPEQDYFVDGVTESLTTDLSRMRGMLVHRFHETNHVHRIERSRYRGGIGGGAGSGRMV